MEVIISSLIRKALQVVSILLVVCTGYGCEGRCTAAQTRALQEIKRSINSPGGSALSGWEGEDCCAWEGVTCSHAASGVAAIDLSAMRNAPGQWFPNVTLFSQLGDRLEVLNLAQNNVGGWVMPEAFCNLKNLKQLLLGSNFIGGGGGGIPPCICSMPSLTQLDLSTNNLRGNISDCLCDLPSLSQLYLSENRLGGSIPTCLGRMGSLAELDVSTNRLRGDLPASLFSNLTLLTKLYLAGNGFEGVFLFSMLANLSSLYEISLSYNYNLEIETESPSWVPTFQLGYLYMTNCNVNRRSRHRGLPSFLPTQTKLLVLEMMNDSIAGPLPSWVLYNSSLSYATLRDNNFTGRFPLPPQNATSALNSLDFSNGRISGTLPPNIGDLFPGLFYMYLGGNHLEGSIPPSLGAIQSLNSLFLEDNNFSGGIPTSLMQNSSSLKILVLSNNQLRGEMLPRDVNMPMLKCLQVNGNAFTGTVSPGLSNSSALKVLDVGNNHLKGPIPAELPLRLRAVLLSGNSFRGSIPRQLCQMQQIQIYDVASNLVTGRIPTCIKNISSWKNGFVPDETEGLQAWGWGHSITVSISTKNGQYPYKGEPISSMFSVDMSSNRLAGAIPLELGELTGIRSLNLSYNQLGGPLPNTLGNIRNLESLDLSHNEINGSIPADVSRLQFLTTFSVAYNNLSGEIPTGNQFSSFTERSYEGNPGLCGQLLGRNCSDTDGGTVVRDGAEGGGGKRRRIDSETLIFYAVVAVSFVVGFWGVLAFLFLHRERRVRYLKAVDKHLDAFLDRLRGRHPRT